MTTLEVGALESQCIGTQRSAKVPAYLGTYLVCVQAGDPAMADRNGKEGVVCPPLGCWLRKEHAAVQAAATLYMANGSLTLTGSHLWSRKTPFTVANEPLGTYLSR